MCTTFTPGFRVEARYIDDSITGAVASNSPRAVSFYIGEHPGFGDAISRQAIRLKNPAVLSAVEQEHSEGRHTVTVILKDRKRPDQVIVFWDVRNFAADPSFIRIVEALKICDIR